MAITSSVIVHDDAQANGKRRITERHTWHDDLEQIYHYNAPALHDADAAMAARVIKYNVRVITDEKLQVEDAIANGSSPTGLLAKLRHNTPKQVLKALLRGFMRIEDAKQAIRVAKFIRDKVTNTDLNAEIGSALRIKVRDRALALITMEADWLAAEAEKVEIP